MMGLIFCTLKGTDNIYIKCILNLLLTSLLGFFCVCGGVPAAYGKVPRLGVKSELQLPDNTTATATRDLSHVCNLHHSSPQPT